MVWTPSLGKCLLTKEDPVRLPNLLLGKFWCRVSRSPSPSSPFYVHLEVRDVLLRNMVPVLFEVRVFPSEVPVSLTWRVEPLRRLDLSGQCVVSTFSSVLLMSLGSPGRHAWLRNKEDWGVWRDKVTFESYGSRKQNDTCESKDSCKRYSSTAFSQSYLI